MFSVRQVAVEDRLMPPLVVGVTGDQRVLRPDAHTLQAEAGVDVSLAENMTYGIRMEHITDTAGLQAVCHIGKTLDQEAIELLVLDAIVFNGQTCGTLKGNAVGRVGQNQVRSLAVHECSDIFFGGRISTI